MLHGHLPVLISRLGGLMRHVSYLYHSTARMIEVGFYSIQTGRGPRKWTRGLAAPDKRRRARWSRPLLIHYHIFKNAGTSFEWTLREAFEKCLHSFDSPTSDGILSRAQIANYAIGNPRAKVIVSHQAVLPPPKIRGCSVISSVLIRDPIARIRSIYAFERKQNIKTRGAQKAKELDFRGYVEWRFSSSPGMFCNFQVYFCSRTSQSAPFTTITEEHLERAIENLDRIDIVGTVERYAQWLALAQTVLSHSFPDLSLTVARHNVTRELESNGHAHILDHLIKELGRELAERLLQCNHLDMRLHQVADAMLTRGLAEHGLEVQQRDAYARAWKSIPGQMTENGSGDR